MTDPHELADRLETEVVLAELAQAAADALRSQAARIAKLEVERDARGEQIESLLERLSYVEAQLGHARRALAAAEQQPEVKQ